MSLAELKLRAHKHSETINDWFISSVTLAVKKYHETTGDGKVPQSNLRMETAASTHVKENLDNFEPYNKIIANDIYPDFKDDLNSTCDETRKCIKTWKDTENMMVFEAMLCIILNYSPPFVFKLMIGNKYSKQSLSLSNMAGPRVSKWVFDGNKTHWVTMTTYHVIPEVTLTSLHDTVKITISGDQTKFKDFKHLLVLLEE